MAYTSLREAGQLFQSWFLQGFNAPIISATAGPYTETILVRFSLERKPVRAYLRTI